MEPIKQICKSMIGTVLLIIIAITTVICLNFGSDETFFKITPLLILELLGIVAFPVAILTVISLHEINKSREHDKHNESHNEFSYAKLIVIKFSLVFLTFFFSLFSFQQLYITSSMAILKAVQIQIVKKEDEITSYISSISTEPKPKVSEQSISGSLKTLQDNNYSKIQLEQITNELKFYNGIRVYMARSLCESTQDLLTPKKMQIMDEVYTDVERDICNRMNLNQH
ncbi:hypothetical protein [Pseudomonas sp. NBRC 111121]|uniref:hypothetical protein n=1 Tax=Pseudomonas sp. NBRC 111121 TaxID=1661036 RepID=UPI000AB9B13D|nr:hypothetical protein [Pseudomonas sp. NBRC 111121]